MVEHIVTATYKTGWCNRTVDNGTPNLLSSSESDGQPLLSRFIFRLARAARIHTGTLMCTVVYLARLQKQLSQTPPLERCSAHSVFLSVLILADKYLHDANPTSEEWAECCSDGAVGYGFNAREITRIEVQTLCHLGWDISLPEEELYVELGPLLSPIRQQLHWIRISRSLLLPVASIAYPSIKLLSSPRYQPKK